MAKETPGQQAKVAAIMREWKQGQLKANGGRKVRNPKQAIAIALHQAGASRDQTGEPPPPDHARMTRAELYAEARRRHIPNRSGMTKQQLQQALDPR